jgi:hypothetical protein
MHAWLFAREEVEAEAGLAENGWTHAGNLLSLHIGPCTGLGDCNRDAVPNIIDELDAHS